MDFRKDIEFSFNFRKVPKFTRLDIALAFFFFFFLFFKLIKPEKILIKIIIDSR